MEPALKLRLLPATFTAQPTRIFTSAELNAEIFTYSTGVAALRLTNSRGHLDLLPFQGQQVWRACFDDQDLAMQTMFAEPEPTTEFLATYGGFMLHCGVRAMGNPSPTDTHPPHGELPNFPYTEAYLIAGVDDSGAYVGLTGRAVCRNSFAYGYVVEPELRLYAGATTFHAQLHLSNLRTAPFEYMYLCHINFPARDGIRLLSTAPVDPEHLILHPDLFATVGAARECLAAYHRRLEENIRLSTTLDRAAQVYDPEIVFTMHHLPDKAGRAHTLGLLPEGGAYYVAHRRAELPLALRWIARTGNEEALGMVLPCTAEHHGYNYARERGQLRTLPGGETISMSVEVGYLSAEATAAKCKELGDLLV